MSTWKYLPTSSRGMSNSCEWKVQVRKQSRWYCMVTGGTWTHGEYRAGRSAGGTPKLMSTSIKEGKKKSVTGWGVGGSPHWKQVHTTPRVANTLPSGASWISIVISSSALTYLALVSNCLQDVDSRRGREEEERRERREGKEELGITILATQDFHARL